jgi:hypothetical protein
MTRTLVATLIVGILALPATLPLSAVAEPTVPAVVAPDATDQALSGSEPCALQAGTTLAAGDGCCGRQGGVCGCRNTRPKCCNGAMAGDGCSCRADSPWSEAVDRQAL